MAEREGFEPPIPVKVCLISSQVHSTALPSLRAVFSTAYRLGSEGFSITYDLNYVIDSSRVSVPREERVSRRLKHVGAEVVSAIESTGGKCPLCLPLCVMPCVSAARLIARLGYLGEIALQDRIDGQVIPALSIHSLLDFELYSVDGPGRALPDEEFGLPATVPLLLDEESRRHL